MARELSKKNLELVLTQAMMAAENVRTQRGRLLELHRRLLRHQHQAEAEIGQLATDVFNVYFHGLDAGAKMLAFCLGVAVQNRAVSTINIAFALMPDDQLHDALLAQRLPARPTTQAEALARVDSALLAVKTLGEHHLPRCVECLVGGRAPVRGKLDLSVADATATEGIAKVDPVAAAAEGIAKVDLLSDDPVAAAATEGIAKVDLHAVRRPGRRQDRPRRGQGGRLPVPSKQDDDPRREAHRPRRRRPLPLRRPQGARPPRRLDRRFRLPRSRDQPAAYCFDRLIRPQISLLLVLDRSRRSELMKTHPPPPPKPSPRSSSPTTTTRTPRPREAASGGEVDKALDYMYRANRMASLAVKVKHIDVGVSVLSRFMEPKKEAGQPRRVLRRLRLHLRGGILSGIRLIDGRCADPSHAHA